MHTTTVGPKLSTSAMHPGLAHVAQPGSVPLMPPPPMLGAKSRVSPRTRPANEQNGPAEFAEKDAMFANDQGLGIFAGLRVALLFNAGIAVAGLVAWEFWAMLAQ